MLALLNIRDVLCGLIVIGDNIGLFQISTGVHEHPVPGHDGSRRVPVGLERIYTSSVCVFLVRPETSVTLTSSSSYPTSGLDVSRVSRASDAPVSACR